MVFGFSSLAFQFFFQKCQIKTYDYETETKQMSRLKNDKEIKKRIMNSLRSLIKEKFSEVMNLTFFLQILKSITIILLDFFFKNVLNFWIIKNPDSHAFHLLKQDGCINRKTDCTIVFGLIFIYKILILFSFKK